MGLSEAMSVVESHEFAARVNLASDSRTFLCAAAEEDAVQVIYDEMHAGCARHAILKRVAELSRREVDPRYENPWDAALAVYLWLLRFRDRGLAESGAELASRARQCWWAAKIAQQLLSGIPWAGEVGLTEGASVTVSALPESVQGFSDAGEGVYRAHFLSNSDYAEPEAALSPNAGDSSGTARDIWTISGEGTRAFLASSTSFTERSVA